MGFFPFILFASIWNLEVYQNLARKGPHGLPKAHPSVSITQ